MASEAQIAANRRNALRSTGPRTEEGKARVAQNGLKHGLCSSRVLLPDEDAAEFEALVADLAARFRPAGEVELALLREYAAALWRLDRIPALEAALLRSADGDLGQAFLARSAEILRLSLHEGRLARARERARKELQALQAARRQAAAELALASRPAREAAPPAADDAWRWPRPPAAPLPPAAPQAREAEPNQPLAGELALLSRKAA